VAADPRREAEGPGRRWGTPRRGWDAAVFLDVDDATGELLRRVSYWSSAAATRALREWTRRWGRGPAHIQAPPGVTWTPPTLAALERREELRGQILSVGDIGRAIIHRAGTGFHDDDDA